MISSRMVILNKICERKLHYCLRSTFMEGLIYIYIFLHFSVYAVVFVDDFLHMTIAYDVFN